MTSCREHVVSMDIPGGNKCVQGVPFFHGEHQYRSSFCPVSSSPFHYTQRKPLRRKHCRLNSNSLSCPIHRAAPYMHWQPGIGFGTLIFARTPFKAGYGITLVPAALYGLDQVQNSSLIAEAGSVNALSVTGPEINQHLSLSLFELLRVSIRHQFLWVSVQQLSLNETGDAWTSTIEGTQNHILQALGSVDVPLPSGALRIGLGWKQHWSIADSSGTAVLDSGLIVELLVTTKNRGF